MECSFTSVFPLGVPLGVQRGGESDQQLAARGEGAGGGHQAYLQGTDNISFWESLVTVLHKETLPDICIGIPCNGQVTFYQTSNLKGEKSKYIAKHRQHFMMSQKSDYHF